MAHPNRLGTPQRGGSCLPAFQAVQTLPDSPLCRQRLPSGLKNAAGPVLSTSGTQPAIYTSAIAGRHYRQQTYEMLNRVIDDKPCTVLSNRAARRMKTKKRNKSFPTISTETPVPLGFNLDGVGHPRINLWKMPPGSFSRRFFSFTNDWSRTGPLLLGLQRKTHAVRPIVANFQDFRDSSIKLDAVARRRHFLQLFHQNA